MLITNETTNVSRKNAGGKGFNLYMLSKANFNVPEWIILDTDTFKYFKTSNGLDDKINIELKKLVDLKDKSLLQDISENIKRIIIDTPFDLLTSTQIEDAYKYFRKTPIAVRSSGNDEDSDTHSFAGMFDSYLSVKTLESTKYAVKKCWASAYSEKCLTYRLQNNLVLNSKEINIALVFQRMINANSSGVLFTCDPTNGDTSKIIINSVFGIGEGVVLGKQEADLYIVNKKSLKKESAVINLKLIQLVQNDKSDGLQEVGIKSNFQTKDSLTDAELKELTQQAIKIEEHFGTSQDIEWAIVNESVVILQTRPITAGSQNSGKILNIWDNSNIIESYGGITLPLTFTFARYVYHQVYVQFCEILMVPQDEIRKMDNFLKSMLGIFYGRIYYNLLNWYRLTSILPGYKYNRNFMETMMGTNKSLENEIAERVRPPVSLSKIVTIFTGIKFLYFHFVIQRKVDQFLKYFWSIYDKYKKLDYSKMSSDEILEIYRSLENTILRQWKAPIINDYLCMVHFGILKKLTSKWLSNFDKSLQNDLLCGTGNLESAQPTKELMRIAKLIKNNPNQAKLIQETESIQCLQKIMDSEYEDLKNNVNNYIDLYGYRCMNEMKLEQKDLYQDPSFLFDCVKSYIESDNIDYTYFDSHEREIRLAAEKIVDENLKGIKRSVYLWSLKNTRRAVRNRENTRFCRTRIYGIVRRCFYNIGRNFASQSIIDEPEDIFYLELDEVLGSFDATLTVQNLKYLIQLRKDEYKKYPDIQPADRFITRGPVYWMNDPTIRDQNEEKLKPNTLKGIGCCPGIVEKEIKIVRNAKDNVKLSGQILVAERTDPGWIPLYPMISGLLVERGSLLSHSAIVAREMGIPTIVGVKGLINSLSDGAKIRMDGQKGIIEIL